MPSHNLAAGSILTASCFGFLSYNFFFCFFLLLLLGLSKHLNRCSHLFKWWVDELIESGVFSFILLEKHAKRDKKKTEVGSLFFLLWLFLWTFCGRLSVGFLSWPSRSLRPITCLISRWPNSPPECALCSLCVALVVYLDAGAQKCLQFGLLLFFCCCCSLGLTMDAKLTKKKQNVASLLLLLLCLDCVSFFILVTQLSLPRGDLPHATRWQRSESGLVWSRIDLCQITNKYHAWPKAAIKAINWQLADANVTITKAWRTLLKILCTRPAQKKKQLDIFAMIKCQALLLFLLFLLMLLLLLLSMFLINMRFRSVT